MADGRDEAPEDRQREPAREAPVVPSERVFLRLTFWQTVLSVAGVFVAVVALYAALTESAAVRQQTAAAVWPFVQFQVQDSDTGEAAEFSISFNNAGVGPARMRTMRLVIDDTPIRDWAHAVAILDGKLSDQVSRNFISGRVLSPDESVVVFSTTDSGLARRFQAVVANPDNSIVYCYCSIFDECWLADSRQVLADPEIVETCPDFGDDTFRN